MTEKKDTLKKDTLPVSSHAMREDSLINVAIVGATGYTGSELLRIVLDHPKMRLVAVTSEKQAGSRLNDVWPHLSRHIVLPQPSDGKESASELVFQTISQLCSDLSTLQSLHVVFLALPHGEAAEVAVRLLDASPTLRVIDLSADFRLKNLDAYHAWYGADGHHRHPAPQWLGKAVYGLVEYAKPLLKEARLVASPGCYATSIILALRPLLQAGVIEAQPIIAHAVSGVSGAGRTPHVARLFCEVDATGMQPYALSGHRHHPEIMQELRAVTKSEIELAFIPHIAPMSRGILASCYVKPTTSAQEIHDALTSAYADKPLVEVLPFGQAPSTGHVAGSQRCRLGVVALSERMVLVCSAIDNLGKGASGQAVQACNVMFGWPETTGLVAASFWPMP